MARLTDIQASPLSDPNIRSLIMQRVIAKAPLLQFMDFTKIVGNSSNERKKSSSAGEGQTRNINSEYTTATEDPEFVNVALKILGGEVQTDIANIRRGLDFSELHIEQLEAFADNLAPFFMDQFVNGAGTGKNAHGLEKLVPPENRIKLDTNGLLVKYGTSDEARKSQRIFLRTLKKAINKIDGGSPSVLVMNSDTLSMIDDIGQNYVRTTSSQTALGDMLNLTHYKNIPIIDAGYKAEGGGEVMTNTETCGTSQDCTSIYVVKFGRRDLAAVTSAGIDVIDKSVKGVHKVTMVDWDFNQVLLNDKALYKIEGIRLDD